MSGRTLNSEGARRQVEPYFEAASLVVDGLGRASMSLHDLGGDGEADAFATGVAVARFGDAIKRLEYTLQIAGGHSRSPIPNQDHDAARIAARDRDIDGGSLRAVAHGVAQHVLDGASHQLAVAGDAGTGRPPQENLAILDGALEVRI